MLKIAWLSEARKDRKIMNICNKNKGKEGQTGRICSTKVERVAKRVFRRKKDFASEIFRNRRKIQKKKQRLCTVGEVAVNNYNNYFITVIKRYQLKKNF